jgi:subtilisin family serine protease
MARSACIAVTVALLLIASCTREAPAMRVQAQIGPAIIDEMNQSPRIKDDDMTSVIVTGFSNFSDSQIRQLSNLGTVNTVIGEVATLRLPLSNIWSLSHVDFVNRIDDGVAKPLLDISVPSIGANLVWETIKDAQGRRTDGSGVIIGIVDTGIDWKHPDFKFENESSKILFLWDQTQTGTAPSGYTYGTEWARSQIEAGACTEKDTYGHGTHVAGIAAGTGKAREGKYVGVAPGAALIFVKSGRLGKKGWNFRFSEVLDGVTYIWRKAITLGRRAVISLSLGGHAGSHDGTSAIETGLDRLTSEGAIITVAAGNSGDSKVHAEGKLHQGESVNLKLKADVNETEFYVETWYSRSDVFGVSLTTPSGHKVQGPTTQASTSEGRATILEYSTENGKAWVVSFSSSEILPLEGWTITLTGKSITNDGAWDLWIGSYGELETGLGYEITNRKTIGIPGTAKNVITVGAYVTKMSWTNKSGERIRYSTSEKEGDIAVFSSMGPTRDGRLKPEICAPGKGIVAARSSDAPTGFSDPDDFYCIKQGTSMAAPHIAGVMALVLQYNPYLGSNEAKMFLQSTGKQDERTGTMDSTQGSMVWGYGKVDAKPFVTKTSGTSSIRISAKGNEYVLQYYVRVSSGFGNPRGSGWYDAGSKATISIESKVVTEVINVNLIYKKTTYLVFDQWIVQMYRSAPLNATPETMILVNSPLIITAEWRKETVTNLDWTMVAVLIGVVVATVFSVTSVVRRKRLFLKSGSVKPFQGTEVQTTLFCMNCGARLRDDWRYCLECGREVAHRS